MPKASQQRRPASRQSGRQPLNAGANGQNGSVKTDNRQLTHGISPEDAELILSVLREGNSSAAGNDDTMEEP